MEILAAVLSPVLEYAIKPFMRHVSYPFNWKRNVGDLEENVQALKHAKERVEDEKETERRNGKEIYGAVDEWLKKADETVEKESEELVQAKEKVNTKCLFGAFPHLMKRYHVSRKAEQKTGDVAKLLQKKFSAIARPAPLPSTEALSAGDYEAFESRQSFLEEVKTSLTRDDVRMVGVHGIGGMGKATLAKEVARQAKQEDLFDKVIFVAVTIDVNIEKIQDQIADQLGLKFDEKSVEGRASRLSERLKQEKKLLLILDDLWQTLALGAVGIPSSKQHTGHKMLLTSRDLEVLSNGMDCQKDCCFAVDALPENEAWDLFKRMAENNFENDDLYPIAVKVAKICAGLPIVIVTTARTLKNKKSLSEWRKALKELKRPQMGNHSEAHSAIKFSYDNLENEEIKSIFLLCSQVGYNASVRDLLKYGIGLGLFHNDFTLQEVQDTVFSSLNRLKALCLFMEGSKSEEIVMHDVVRETGRMIASGNHGVLVIADDNDMGKLLGDEDRLKDKRAIWIHGSMEKLPEKMRCAKLVLFHVNGKDTRAKVSDKVFEGVNKLKVLSLSSFSISSLPSSLVFLQNLKTLCFHGLSELGDVSSIGELKKLEVLSFASSKIMELPNEIGKLARLKLLDLSNCDKLEVIAPNVLSKLSQLEELYMFNSFHNWDIQGQRASSLSELKDLASLTTLEITIPDVKLVQRDIFNKKLCRYKIFIGEFWFLDYFFFPGDKYLSDDEYILHKMSKTLLLDLKDGSIDMDSRIMQLMKESEELYLKGLKGVKNFGYELGRNGFPKLKHLHLFYCPDIQYVAEAMEMVSSFPLSTLEFLVLKGLVSLEKIHHCRDVMLSFFGRLRIINVTECDRLIHLFSGFVAQGLSQLQEIKVWNCKSIEDIFSMEEELSNPIELPQLQELTLGWLPKFKSFCCKDLLGREENLLENDMEDNKKMSMALFNDKISFPSLKKLDLQVIGNIEMLWHGQFPPIQRSFQNLTELNIWKCDSLKYVLSYPLIKCLTQLKNMNIWDCKEMEEVLGGMEEEYCGKEQRILFPKLQSIRLRDLPELRRFCKGHLLECPLLKTLEIEKCGNLETFVSVEEQQQVKGEGNNTPTQILFNEKVLFPNLVDLYIGRMDNVEKILEVEGSNTDNAKEMSFSKLRSVKIEKCVALKEVFPWSTAKTLSELETFRVSDCGDDAEVIGKRGSHEGDDDDDDASSSSSAIVWPKLKELDLEWPSFLSFVQKVKCNNFQLSKLVVPDVIATDMLQLHFPDHVLSGVKVLQLERFDLDDGIPLGFLHKYFHNLEELHLVGFYGNDASSGSVEELFSCHGVVPENEIMLPQLKDLYVENLANLRHVFLGVNISPSLASFQNLTCLCVKSCHGSSSLITVRTAKSLCQLVKLEVKYCEMVTEIMVKEGDEMENDEELIFTNLQSLQLVRLTSLASFYSGNHKLNFPYPDEVIVEGCPKMRIFSQEN